MWGPCVGAHRFSAGRIQRLAEMGCRRPIRASEPEPAGDRDTVPVTMAPDIGVGERGVMGAPRSHHRRGSPRAIRARSWRGDSSAIRDRQEAKAATRCSGSSTPRTSTSARATTISGSRRPPSASASSPPSRPTVDLALAEKVDLFLIAGDLFDSNVQPRRSVERVAAELKRLVEARIRTVIIPGTHDVYDRASIYRAYDLAALAGSAPGRRPGHGPRSRTIPRSTCRRSTSSSTARSSPRSARRTARSRASADRRRTPTPRPAATWRDRDGPRRDRDPRQDRARRGRHHDRRDRRERSRLPRARPLALDPDRQGRAT